jgi:hypothetical protein
MGGRLFAELFERRIGFRKAYEDMGVMQFADIDIAAKLEADEDWAKELDANKAQIAAATS